RPGVATRGVRTRENASSGIGDNTRMPVATTSSPIACVSGPLAAIDADLLVIPWFEDESPDALPGIDAATGGELARALSATDFGGSAYDLFLTPIVERGWRARRLAVIGGGRRSEATTERVRRLASAAGIAARRKHVGRAAFAIRGEGDLADLAQ